jgi:pseudouridine synthase
MYELLPEKFHQYYYIGRLDKESRGLVLLTNSPELVHQYEHPSFNITKEYLIQLSSSLSLADQQKTKI